ncbi:MAG TPA: hypothetical protein VLC46_07905 [Thermoanaerobaculia bacterium]|jgi:hypothetical protein|nr:hypothetical protein [Thermoanaerobaculia bacterium]
MPVAKIQIAVGSISFSGEGEQKWLAEQFDKLLEKAASLAAIAPEAEEPGDDEEAPNKQGSRRPAGTLASFLTSTGAGNNQVKRFLATAEWLHRKGDKKVNAKLVAKALQDNHQKRLGNPADCLNKNVSKGHCEKVDNWFYVTDDGRRTLKTA